MSRNTLITMISGWNTTPEVKAEATSVINRMYDTIHPDEMEKLESDPAEFRAQVAVCLETWGM